MINTLILTIIVAIGICIKSFQQIEIFNNATYALGLIMLVGYIAGDLVKKIKLPSITGCILAGILVGPFGLELISVKNVDDLQLLNGLALSIIAL
jgi:Kef-type K+ transport system membrane component KefB